MEKKVYLNGTILPISQATVSVADQGFLHGISTFTTILAKNGAIVGFDYHLKRISETVKMLGLQIDVTTGELVDGAYQVLDANGLTDARMRITLTPGTGKDDSTVLITADALAEVNQDFYKHGIKTIVSSFKQTPGDPVYGFKTGCYLTRILARQEAASKKADDAIWFTTDNLLAEACFANIFLVKNGIVLTPPRQTPVLPGFVRQCVLDICRELDLPVEDSTPLDINDLLSADEVFLTGSCAGIVPVRQIEQHIVGQGEPGEITQAIRKNYLAKLDEVTRD